MIYIGCIVLNNNLEQQAQAIYSNMVPYSVDDALPTEWYKGTVEDIIEIHDSKRIPLSGQARQKMEKKTYPYYGAASLMTIIFLTENIFFLVKMAPLLMQRDFRFFNTYGASFG